MPTVNQLIRIGRKPNKAKSKSSALNRCPQRRGVLRGEGTGERPGSGPRESSGPAIHGPADRQDHPAHAPRPTDRARADLASGLRHPFYRGLRQRPHRHELARVARHRDSRSTFGGSRGHRHDGAGGFAGGASTTKVHRHRVELVTERVSQQPVTAHDRPLLGRRAHAIDRLPIARQ